MHTRLLQVKSQIITEKTSISDNDFFILLLIILLTCSVLLIKLDKLKLICSFIIEFIKAGK